MDIPKSLKNPATRATRLSMLSEAHIAPLVAFVAEIRREMGNEYQIPEFDPMDGGTQAECLFLMEAPGQKAIASGFKSRNNPDETAKNFFELNQAVGLKRSRTVSWNVVPWYVGNGTKIRPVNVKDLERSLPYISRLLKLLPRLRLVVLVGQKAARAELLIAQLNPSLKILKTPHPSPLFVNRSPENRAIIQDSFWEVVAILDGKRPSF